jgi:formate-dependent nitrite reductase membrane component NrfD
MNPTVHPLPEAPWGAIIGVYFMLVGLATGVTLVAYWVHPEDARAQVHYAWVTTWAAFLILVAGSVLLVVDLGQPARFHLMVASVSNLGSPMSIGAKLIAAKLFLLAVSLSLLARRRGAVAVGDLSVTGSATRALLSLVPAALAVVSLALAVYPAVLLARTWSAPLARTPVAGVLFLSTALLMGAAAALILACLGRLRGDLALRGRLRDVILWLVVGQIPLLGLWLLSVDTHHAPLATALSHLLHGTGAAVFWLAVIGVGLGLPAGLLPRVWSSRIVAIWGALAVLVGASTTRYLFFSLS